jgi:hypothetical protein
MALHMQTPEEAETWKKVMQPPVLDAFYRLAPENGRKIAELLGKL